MTASQGNSAQNIQVRYDSGFLERDFYVLNGDITGHYYEYYDGPGLPKKVHGFFQNGKAEGKYYTYFPDGGAASITEHKNGLAHGSHFEFDPKTHVVRAHRQFKENKLEGVSEDYDKNGKLERLVVFSNNKFSWGATTEFKVVLRIVQFYDHARTLLGLLNYRPTLRQQIDETRMQLRM